MDSSHDTSRDAAGKPGTGAPVRYPLGGSEAIGHAAASKKPRARRLAVRHKVSGANRRVRSA